MIQGSVWNSVEIAQLGVSFLTPLAVALLGIAVARSSKRAEQRAAETARFAANVEWANRRAVDRLIELHKEMAPLLNDLMCFFRFIGHFRQIDPPTALATKRQLDRVFYANEHLFSARFRQLYRSFMRKCFAQWETPAQDAKMKASASDLRRERGHDLPWEEDWSRLFQDVPHARELRHEQQALYNEVMSAFAVELGLSRDPSPRTA